MTQNVGTKSVFTPFFIYIHTKVKLFKKLGGGMASLNLNIVPSLKINKKCTNVVPTKNPQMVKSKTHSDLQNL